jgi:formate dehydrogenase accessory protein FdhE
LSPSEGSVWSSRRARALALVHRAPHAAEILTFYVGLLELQERVAGEAQALADAWVGPDGSDGETALLHPERLPVGPLLTSFTDFLGGLREIGTRPLAQACAHVLSTEEPRRRALLGGALSRHPEYSSPGDPVAPDTFLLRVFLEPIAAALASVHLHRFPELTTAESRRCPACRARPAVTVLGDRPDALGSRRMGCARCATEWRSSRRICPACGETHADRLVVHTTEAHPHVRVDECSSCQRYIKSFDLRKDGSAVAVVDDIATIELDLWARDRGLTRIGSGVLGS